MTRFVDRQLPNGVAFVIVWTVILAVPALIVAACVALGWWISQ